MSSNTVGRILLWLINLRRREKIHTKARVEEEGEKLIQFGGNSLHSSHMHTHRAVSSSLRLFHYDDSCLIPVELGGEEQLQEEMQ